MSLRCSAGVHTAPPSALKIHMCRWIAKEPVERKKNLGIRSGTTLSVCHCSSSRGQSEAPATAHNSFYLSAGICFARQWESVFSCCNFFTIFVGNFPALVQYLFVAEVVVDPSSQLWTTRTGGGGGGSKQRRDPGGVSC